MLYFLKPGLFVRHLRLTIVHHHAKFGAKILIDAQIMPQKIKMAAIVILNWFPMAILNIPYFRLSAVDFNHRTEFHT